ncbi:hypothetical protein [uncultured Maribacter sp.]|uniref:hypothetical protein n=1 Tax=uncultured Maribacter sp. TaxID=431308 RepID=UPI002620BC9D|nr:hypothetical protein [uncultured Maribacter sp.]
MNKNLILIQDSIANGSEDIFVINQDEYIMRKNGNGNNPGLLLYINTYNQIKEKKSLPTVGYPLFVILKS